MRLIELILWLSYVSTVLGAPYFHRSYDRLNPRRSLRHPWYRHSDELTARVCKGWNAQIPSSEENQWKWEGETENGHTCMKIQGNIKIMTYCKFILGEEFNYLYFIPTVVDTRESNIDPCYEYDVTIKGVYGTHGEPERQYCKVILIDGVLWCVEESDMVSGDEILYLFPQRRDRHVITYNICAARMEKYCSMPAILPSLGVRNEVLQDISSPFTGIPG